MNKPVTLSDFRASREYCADIGERLGLDFGSETPRAGYIYDGDCYIETGADGSLYLLIGRADWKWTVGTGNMRGTALAHLEAILYCWAVGECGDEFGVPADVWNFLDTLQAHMSLDDLATALERNAVEPDRGVCHTHDFCDANMACAEALEITEVTDANLERMQKVWNDAAPWLRDEAPPATDDERSNGPR
jgi:hypothetical protein